MSFENMIIMGKASQKLTTGGYLKNDAKDIRSSVLQDNVSIPQYFYTFAHNTHRYKLKTYKHIRVSPYR